jgi:hypothetical protein
VVGGGIVGKEGVPHCLLGVGIVERWGWGGVGGGYPCKGLPEAFPCPGLMEGAEFYGGVHLIVTLNPAE